MKHYFKVMAFLFGCVERKPSRDLRSHNYCGWLRNPFHFERCRNHCLLVFTGGIKSKPGFLNGANWNSKPSTRLPFAHEYSLFSLVGFKENRFRYWTYGGIHNRGPLFRRKPPGWVSNFEKYPAVLSFPGGALQRNSSSP